MSCRVWFLVFLSGILTGWVRADCPDSWVSFRGSCYFFGKDAKTFTEAEHFCLHHDAHLVHVETNDESLFLKSFCRQLKNDYYWIGITDQETEGIWKWTDTDEAAEFTDFYPGEPARGSLENCGVMWTGFNFQWGDYNCSYPEMPLCEKGSSISGEIIG